MDTFDCILTKLDIREFSESKVPADVKRKVLDAARFTGSSMNTQHWRFLLVQKKENLARLAEDSTTGKWVSGADFAIIILIDPKIPGSDIDSGRVLQDLQLAAWNFGVASGLFTGIKHVELRRDFGIPENLKPVAVVGFGYPKKKLKARRIGSR
jgi:Nitroreductase